MLCASDALSACTLKVASCGCLLRFCTLGAVEKMRPVEALCSVHVGCTEKQTSLQDYCA